MNNRQAACERLAQSRDRLRQALSQGANQGGSAQVRLLAESACEVVATVARNRPLAAVMGTAVVGALLVRTKAWRWLSLSTLFAALMPQIVKALASPEKP